MVRFQQRMHKKMFFQNSTVFKLLKNKITFSYLSSASRESTNGIAANYVLLNILINLSTYSIVSNFRRYINFEMKLYNNS